MSTGPKLDKETAPATAPGAATKPPAGGSGEGPQTLLLVAVLAIVALIGALIWVIASGKGQSWGDANNQAANAAGPQMPNRGRLLPSGLRFESIREGTGPLVRPTDRVALRYELRVVGRDGLVEGNFNEPQPAPMSLASTVPGFTEALSLMRAGGEARFWVPPNLGYGDQAPPGGPFGPNDILEFRVRVERILPPEPAGAGPSSNDINAALEALEAQQSGNSSNATNGATETRGRR